MTSIEAGSQPNTIYSQVSLKTVTSDTWTSQHVSNVVQKCSWKKSSRHWQYITTDPRWVPDTLQILDFFHKIIKWTGYYQWPRQMIKVIFCRKVITLAYLSIIWKPSVHITLNWNWSNILNAYALSYSISLFYAITITGQLEKPKIKCTSITYLIS